MPSLKGDKKISKPHPGGLKINAPAFPGASGDKKHNPI